MAQITTTPAGMTDAPVTSGKSAASWSAIFAGAVAAAGISIILLALGSGLGFASISPWPGRGVTATTFVVTTAIWLIVTQWLSSAVGGYLAGRLRTKWVGTHTHEVFFRDTAHGLVTWSLATVIIAVLAASSVFTALGGGAHAAMDAAGAGAHGAERSMGPKSMPGMGGPGRGGEYGLDKLFRSGSIRSAGSAGTPGSGAAMVASPGAMSAGGSMSMAGGGGMSAMNGSGGPGSPGGFGHDGGAARAEVMHIVANAADSGTVSDEDRAYLAGLVATHAGIPPAEAQRRVDDFIAEAHDAEVKAKAAADAARKGAAEASIYLALSLLIGAFVASVSAALGGRLRDEHI